VRKIRRILIAAIVVLLAGPAASAWAQNVDSYGVTAFGGSRAFAAADRCEKDATTKHPGTDPATVRAREQEARKCLVARGLPVRPALTPQRPAEAPPP
jgi:hypothetical protein